MLEGLMTDFEILYILESALNLARLRNKPMLAYLITMAMIEAGGFPDATNDNRPDRF
jgi:hypothetical protein